MNWLLEWFDTLGAGAVVLLIVTWLLSKRRSRAESAKIDADSDKVGAESARIIADTAVMLVAPLSDRMGKLEKRIDVLEEEDARKTRLLGIALRFIRELLGLIENHAPGRPPPTIPPELESEIQR